MNKDDPQADERARHRRVIRAAGELFGKMGFRAVTMEAVAREAAISKATLYSYFRNKDELFIAVSSRTAEILGSAFMAELDAPGRPLDDRVAGAVLAKQRLVYKLVRTSPHAEDLFTRKAQIAGDIFARSDDVMLDRLTQAIAEDALLAAEAARLARALFFGSGQLAAHAGGPAEMEADVAAFITTHLAGARAMRRHTQGDQA